MEQIIILPIFAFAILFVILLIVFIIWSRNSLSRAKNNKRKQAEATGLKAQARIVEAKCAGAQRSRNFTIFRLLLEVFPADSQPAFSTSVVWEIAPATAGGIQNGNLIPVKIDSSDLRRIFPEVAGWKYSHQYQHAYLGIEDDFQPEQIISAQKLSPAAPKPNTIYRKRSKINLFGLPLWEIALNLNVKKYARRAKAKAVIAIGDSATGLIAIGTVASGLIAVGRISFGVFSLGGFSFGIVSLGLTAIGLLSIGTLSGGLVAVGGVSAGFFSAGLLPFGLYIFGQNFQSLIPAQLFEGFKNLVGLNFNVFDFVVIASIVSFALFMGSLIGNLVIVKMLTPNNNSLESPRKF